MKLLVFAHKPPPHHGQSYMVQLLLDALGGDSRSKSKSQEIEGRGSSVSSIECFHVDCRLSDDTEDIGRVRWQKVGRLLKFCAQAIGIRWRHGVETFLYIPAPGLRSAVYRDWLAMVCLRPFFRRRIYYWQAAGLGEWLEKGAKPWERWLTRQLLARADLDIVLGESARRDAESLHSKRIEVVPNAVPDPCPDFALTVLGQRQQRALQRLTLTNCGSVAGDVPSKGAGWSFFRVLFMSLCLREKGLFDALEAVALANQQLARSQSMIRVRLDVAGRFWYPAERAEFEDRIRQADLCREPGTGLTAQGSAGVRAAGATRGDSVVVYHGFVTGAGKDQLWRECDCFCIPTYYWGESAPLALLEAMAYGLPVVTTNWRTIPELLPRGYPGVVPPRRPDRMAEALLRIIGQQYDASLRQLFLARYTKEQYAVAMRAILSSLEVGPDVKRGSGGAKQHQN